MTFLDANVIIRYLTMDEPAKAARCERFFDRAARGQEVLTTNILVIAEVVWVLAGVYRVAKERIVDALLPLISLDGVRVEAKGSVLAALGLFREKPIDFVDAYNAVWMQEADVKNIYSYDKDFDRLAGVERHEP